MVKLWFAPQLTLTAPEGLIEPLAPAEALMVKVWVENEALMVWLVRTLLKVKLEIAPCETPSTSTSSMWKQEFAVMVKVWLPPCATLTEPLGLMVPPAPAEAVMVKPLDTLAHQVPHLLPLAPVAPSSVLV